MLAIKAENISKQYRLGQVGTGTLSHDINRFWHTVRGKEDPYLRIGEANDRANKGNSEYVWSLQDINFEIEQGDAVGIIGRNGAGKSTLLKLLSKVTKPTTGRIYTNGRIASLLEVGTGFHPEMTGRENIYLNGAILGMTRKEIKRKFDEIVDFSGVERYIDTPVKRYSSGMYVRLAFAVAAHLESEILIVDEVLAVGDAEFQKKCLGKMGDVSEGEGRTVLFVSHNMASIKQLCDQGIFLENGIIKYTGEIDECINLYSNERITNNVELVDILDCKNNLIKIDNVEINGKPDSTVIINEQQEKIDILIEGFLKEDLLFDMEVQIFDNFDNPVAFYCPAHYRGESPKFKRGRFIIERSMGLPFAFNKGTLFMSIMLCLAGKEVYAESTHKIKISVEGTKMKTGWTFNMNNAGPIYLK